jgi:tRNA A-37 threonylcarbamoyl transferase component Bud32
LELQKTDNKWEILKNVLKMIEAHRRAFDAETNTYFYPSKSKTFPMSKIITGSENVKNLDYVNFIQETDYSTTYTVWDGNEYFVLKNVFEEDCGEGVFEDEVKMQLRASEAGIAPQIKFAFIFELGETKGGVIIMEKLDFTLKKYLEIIPSGELFYLELQKKIEQLHKLNIRHGDLHDENIMLKLAGAELKVYFIDYAHSIYNPDGLTNRQKFKDYDTLFNTLVYCMTLPLPVLQKDKINEMRLLVESFIEKEFQDLI